MDAEVKTADIQSKNIYSSCIWRQNEGDYCSESVNYRPNSPHDDDFQLIYKQNCHCILSEALLRHVW